MDQDLKKYCHVFMVDSGSIVTPTNTNTTKLSKRKLKEVRRPQNAFILYRNNKQSDVIAQNKNITNAEVSKVISKMWKNENEEIKLQWQKLADIEKLKHMKAHPNYVYKPRITKNPRIKKIKKISQDMN
ncbi:1783_t:CDS:1, partial [Gigaspora margarita]